MSRDWGKMGDGCDTFLTCGHRVRVVRGVAFTVHDFMDGAVAEDLTEAKADTKGGTWPREGMVRMSQTRLGRLSGLSPPTTMVTNNAMTKADAHGFRKVMQLRSQNIQVRMPGNISHRRGLT